MSADRASGGETASRLFELIINILVITILNEQYIGFYKIGKQLSGIALFLRHPLYQAG